VQKVDAFLTTVVAGVVVALVGAIAAFYLGGVREKHKRILAKQAEEQRRLEEWRREEQGRRRSFLSNQLKATAASLQPFLVLVQTHQGVDVMDPKSHSDAISWLAGPGLGTFVSPRQYSPVKGRCNAHTNKEAILEGHRQNVLQAANVAKDWDIHVHLRALDAEFGRIEGSRS